VIMIYNVLLFSCSLLNTFSLASTKKQFERLLLLGSIIILKSINGQRICFKKINEHKG
jgi:hypothetical protein